MKIKKKIIIGISYRFYYKYILLNIFIASSDGVTPEKATSKGYWTFLVSPTNINTSPKLVIPITLTYGTGKPADLSWLRTGIKALVTLLNSEIDGHSFQMKNYIMDLPAGMFIYEVDT